ncbi:unnamed protein product [Haemonchus placei]|uniref:ZP domain-containing protein n=1 Tax=Haemonchus placei TaxID=6290 RepID=A0A3P7TY40_HAEPC|nr:unnamed protein product [Haemonchus placei]
MLRVTRRVIAGLSTDTSSRLFAETLTMNAVIAKSGLFALFAVALANVPTLQVFNGHLSIDQPASNVPVQHFVAGQPYTFEIQMGNVLQQDYMVESCTMNGKTFIDNFGCVLCGDGILTSIETEHYARAGAVKRTLVHFVAKQDIVNIACNIRVLNCCGCAERSCERQPVLTMFPFVSHSLMCPVAASPPIPPVVASRPSTSYFPWWLLLLLLLLLLLCCLALCIIPFLLWRKRRKATTTVAEHKRGVGVETDKAVLTDTAVGCRNVHQYAVDSDSVHRVKPVVAVGDRETTIREAEMIARDQRVYRRGLDYRNAECDRASYRNFAYERDMGRVAPLEGFDQVETCEQRRHVCEDEDYDVVERDVKRTHTSRSASQNIPTYQKLLSAVLELHLHLFFIH